MKIKINTNCKNGEHTFIPANTYVDGRDHRVTSFVCQHCLQGVSDEEWSAHLNTITLENNVSLSLPPVIPLSQEEQNILLGIRKSVAGDIYNTKTQQFETPKKRGPKPKQKEIEGL